MDLVFSFADRISVLVNGAHAGGGPAGRSGARSPGEGGLSRRGRRCLIFLLSRACVPAMAKRLCCPSMSLTLRESQVLALLGRNGTGKTTLINSIVGITRRFGGTIALGGQDITAMRPDQRARAGIGWVPQERNIFRSLTVEENMTAVAQPGPWTVDKGLPDVSAAEGTPQQFRQSALRRRAADAGDRPRADAQSQGAAAGRADRGAGADHRGRTAAGARRHYPLRRHLFDHRRAECAKDSGAGRPRCDIGARRDRPRCGEQRAEGRSRGARTLSRRRRRRSA